MSDYDAVCKSFKWPRPRHFNFAVDVLDHWAQNSPDRDAIFWIDDDGGETRASFGKISEKSHRLAGMLRTAGLQTGDSVVLILGRRVEWWESMAACLRGGFIVSPGTTQLSAKDIKYRVNAASAVAVITDAANCGKVDEYVDDCPSLKVRITVDGERAGWLQYERLVARQSAAFSAPTLRLDSPAICFFTSGTTGNPKMVLHSQGYGLAHQVTGKYWLGLGPKDVHWNISDTGWAKAAYSSFFGPWLQGATVFAHLAATFDPRRTLEILGAYPITTMCAAPTVYRMLVQQPLTDFRFPCLRDSVSAGEPLNPEVIEIWRDATGLSIRDGYGQTESVIVCGTFPSLPMKPGSMGKPAPGFKLDVIDASGNILQSCEEGDVAIRVKPEHPLGLFHGYVGTGADLKKCFQGDWYLTGDRAYRDDDGYFWFVGRADDVIISAGYRIGPFEVESALLEHPSVTESAVVSSPDPIRGEIVKAFVVLTPTAVACDSLVTELQDHVKSVTAPYKYPRKIEFVSALPKTVSGKIRRIELRDREWKHQS